MQTHQSVKLVSVCPPGCLAPPTGHNPFKTIIAYILY